MIDTLQRLKARMAELPVVLPGDLTEGSSITVTVGAFEVKARHVWRALSNNTAYELSVEGNGDQGFADLEQAVKAVFGDTVSRRDRCFSCGSTKQDLPVVRLQRLLGDQFRGVCEKYGLDGEEVRALHACLAATESVMMCCAPDEAFTDGHDLAYSFGSRYIHPMARKTSIKLAMMEMTKLAGTDKLGYHPWWS